MNLAASLLLCDKVHIYKDFCLASVGAVLKCNRNLYRSSEYPWGVAAKKHGLLLPHSTVPRQLSPWRCGVALCLHIQQFLIVFGGIPQTKCLSNSHLLSPACVCALGTEGMCIFASIYWFTTLEITSHQHLYVCSCAVEAMMQVLLFDQTEHTCTSWV